MQFGTQSDKLSEPSSHLSQLLWFWTSVNLIKRHDVCDQHHYPMTHTVCIITCKTVNIFLYFEACYLCKHVTEAAVPGFARIVMMYCSLAQQHQVITSLCGVFVQVVVMLVFFLILLNNNTDSFSKVGFVLSLLNVSWFVIT